MEFYKNFFWILLLIVLPGTILYLTPDITTLFFSISSPQNTKKQKHKKTPEIIIQNFNVKEISKDKKDLWVLTSKEGKIFKKLNQIECLETTCFLKEGDQEIALLKSEKAIFDQNAKSLFLYGPVWGNFRELNFSGQNIKYNIYDHTIQTQNQLTYRYLNFKLDAQETVFSLKEDTIKMKNGIRTEISNHSTSNHS